MAEQTAPKVYYGGQIKEEHRGGFFAAVFSEADGQGCFSVYSSRIDSDVFVGLTVPQSANLVNRLYFGVSGGAANEVSKLVIAQKLKLADLDSIDRMIVEPVFLDLEKREAKTD